MAEFELSPYQKSILDFFVNNPTENMYINALAGSGKSSTVCMLTEHTTTSDVYVAFNKSIAEEFKTKIKNPKTKVSTMHSLFYSIMNYNLEKEMKAKAVLNGLKPYKILDEKVQRVCKYEKFEYKMFLKNNYINLYNLCRLTCTGMKDENGIQQLIRDHSLFVDTSKKHFKIPTIKTVVEWLQYLDKRSKEIFEETSEIDFTDMLYITHNKLCEEEWEVPFVKRYTNIYVDEAQDLSVIQLYLLKFIRRKTGRYVFILDKHQCQPYGTKIQLIDDEIKNIEDIKIGDKVVQYCADEHGNGFVGYRSKGLHNSYEVIDKQEFNVTQLITVESQDGKKSSYTTNHRCYVKFNENFTQNAVCLYLMHRNDGLFRIGKVHMYSSQSTLGIKTRAKSEKFDRCWILDIYDTNNEAWVNEQKYSLKYQIPQVIFQDDKTLYDNEDRDNIYKDILPNMRARAIALLDEFGRDINYPLWEKSNIFSHAARTYPFETPACNIIPKYMDCAIFDINHRAVRSDGTLREPRICYSNIIKVVKQIGVFKVVGLTTNHFHTYVADGIVTHNSIYGFAGASCHCCEAIKKLFAPVTEFDLPVNYRCPKSHLSLVQKTFDIPIQPRPDAPDGVIKTIDKAEIVSYIKNGDAVISRKNKWLAEVVLMLAKKNFPVYLEDKEFANGIIKTIGKVKASNLRELDDIIRNKISTYEDTINNISNDKKTSDQDKEKIVTDTNSEIDNLNFIWTILGSYRKENPNSTILNFTSHVKKLLNTAPNKNSVRLSSVHKFKGLENDTVFVLNEGKVCFDPRNSFDLNQQEKNLAYISLTRAKNNLYLVREREK